MVEPKLVRGPKRRGTARTRLWAEALEARDVPATFTVLTTADSGAGSLREAVTLANAAAGPDTIDFNSAAFASPATIALQSQLPQVAFGGLSIVGKGAASLTLTRAGSATTTFRLIDTIASSSLSVSSVTVTGFNNGTDPGGAVAAGMSSTLTLTDAVFSNNTAGVGGAIAVRTAGTLAVTGSSFTGNAGTTGGAIYFANGGTLLIDRSYLSGNAASGALGGGAVYLFAGNVPLSSATISNSTLYNNQATNAAGGGGALFLTGTGGFFNGTITVNNSTLTGNKAASGNGGAVAAGSGANVVVSSSIVAGNTGVNGPDFFFPGGSTVQADNSAIGDPATGFGGAAGSGNLTPAEVSALNLVLPPANNGGPTLTVALAANSSAIDRGVTNNTPTDQRGAGFPRAQGVAADIGAYEAPSVLPFAFGPAGGGKYANITAASTAPYTFTVVYRDDAAVKFSTLQNKNDVVLVTGENGYSQLATFVSATPAANGNSITVTYSVPPGTAGVAGSWDPADNGVYTIEVVAGKVQDTDVTTHTVPQTTLGNFAVRVAQTFTVTNTLDLDVNSNPAAGSLRDAILKANASIETQDTIAFAAGVTGTITLQAVLDTITDAVKVNGPGAASLTVSGDGQFGILEIIGPGQIAVDISGLTLTKGVSAAGGAINIDNESVTLTSVVLANNTATVGGAVSLSGRGAILSVAASTIRDNVATTSNNLFGGGGIYVDTTGVVSVVNSTLSGNSAPNGGRGGAVYTYGGSLNIDNSTVAGNSAFGGGGLSLAFVNATVRNSTIAKNSADANGGGGIRSGGGTVTLVSTLLGDNSTTGSGPDGYTLSAGNVFNASNSLIGKTTNLTFTTDVNNVKDVTTGLGTLGNNGGPTQTIPLLPTSPAINKGSNPAGFGFDQRGTGNPRVFGAAADIGAYEYFTDNPQATLNTPLPMPTAGSTTYTFTVTYTDNTALLASSLQGNKAAITVTGPNGFTATPTVASIDTNTNGTPRAVTYTITAPGGTWDAANDSGTYTITLNANQVSDTAGNKAPATTLGTFNAFAVTYVVTTTADSGAGSLRQALLDANASSGTVDTITFSSLFDTAQTIAVTGGEMAVSDSVVIAGKGSALTTLNLAGKANQRAFNVGGGGVLNVSIAGLTITGASNTAGNPGGAILVADESLTLTGVALTKNSSSASGGAVAALTGAATITFVGCDVSDNSVTGNQSHSGAVFVNTNTTVVVVDSRFTGNTGPDGGAIYFNNGGSLQVRGSTFSGNTATGAPGTTPTDQFIRGGGAVYFFGTIGAGGFTISNSTFDANTAPASNGGAINLVATGGTATIQNSTITGGNAGVSGGAVRVEYSAVTLAVTSSIVAGNTVGGAAASDISSNGATVQANKSAFGTTSGFTPIGTGNLTGFDATANLAPLANNGGPTPTRALQAGSVAINAGSNPAGLTTDQRGSGFARSSGGGVDIGAFEIQVAGGDTVAPTASGTFANVTTRKGTTYTFAVTLADNVAVNAGTVQGADFTVTGPNSYSQAATLVSLSPNANGSPLTATLSVTAPGGTFDVGDNGTYTVSVTGAITDTSGNAVATGSLGTFAVQAPVAVQSVVTKLSDGTTTSLTTTGQRSVIPNIVVTYDGIATGANLAASYKLLNTSTNATVALTASTTTVGGKTVATLTPTAPLANAYYTFTAFGTAVTTANLSPLVVGLDGDNNGTAGGNFTLDFHRFRGDVTGDTAVDGDDLAALAAAFNSVDGDSNYRAYLDLDGDGAVDGNDLAVFAQSFLIGIL